MRAGRTLLLAVADLTPFEAAAGREVVRGGVVIGPRLHALHEEVAALAGSGQGLFLRGESGAGKEITARVFHDAGPRRGGPLVAVNCAAVPKDLAERLLFGTLRGAYSGAVADAEGHLQAARGGTLFLDEIAELDLSVQAKLLRALETREVVPLGGTRAQPIDLGLCSATLRDLREAVMLGRFREDLYYRVGRPEVRLPPLRERREEIPFLIALELEAAGRTAEPALVEACMLRPWPGNVRELRADVRAAAARASVDGSATVLSKHLDDQAGQRFEMPGAAPPDPSRAIHPLPEGLLRRACDALGLAQKTVLKLLPPPALLACHAAAERGVLSEGERGDLLRSRAGEALFALLSAQQFNQRDVAGALGTSRTTLIKLMDGLGLPRAADLDPAAIAGARDRAGGDLAAAARLLRVAPGALRRRAAQLGLDPWS